MKKYKILSLLLVCFMMLGIFTSCVKDTGKESTDQKGKTTEVQKEEEKKDSENKFEKRIKYSATSFDVSEGEDYISDALYKTLSEKFNIEIEFIPLSWDNWVERDRIWINSGDMPDAMFWNFNYADYKNYTSQGLIKQLPADYESKYPNLTKAINRSGIAPYLKQKMDGKLYMVPHVIYMTPITEDAIGAQAIYYRQDWAKQLGKNVEDMVTIEELTDLTRTFIEKDPGENGPGKTIGISSTAGGLYDVFIKAYNTYYASFHKVDGKYVWGPFEESTLEGIKVFSKYFKEGLIDKDYFTIKGKEFNDKFFAGKTGIFAEGCSADNLNGRKSNFSASNPTIDPNEAIAICAVKGPNGKYNGTEMMNYWSTTIFNPNIDDEKLDRILTLYDYIATPEGQKLINLGIEGKDYKVEGDKIIITREKDEHGNFQHITKTHPSAGYFYTKVVLPDDWSINDPSIPAITRDQVKTLFKEKQKIENLSRIDYDLTFFSAPNKDKFNIDVADAITEIILSGKDVEDAWNEWKNTVEPKVNAVLEEINGALAN